MYNPRNEQRLLQELDQYLHIQTQLEAYRDASGAVVYLLLDIEDLKSSCASDAVAPATTPDAVAPPLQQKAQEAISKLKKLQQPRCQNYALTAAVRTTRAVYR